MVLCNGLVVAMIKILTITAIILLTYIYIFPTYILYAIITGNFSRKLSRSIHNGAFTAFDYNGAITVLM